MASAIINKHVQSRILYTGIIKLITELLAVAIFIYATTEIPELLQYKVIVLTLLLLKETISIFENMGKMGIAVPKEIMSLLPNSLGEDNEKT